MVRVPPKKKISPMLAWLKRAVIWDLKKIIAIQSVGA
jgi:hypothetical protein